MAENTATLGQKLFSFATHAHWVNHAQTAWKRVGVRSDDTVCIDAKGRICRMGLHFSIARDEEAFPVTVHMMRGDMPQYQHLNETEPEDPAPERDTLTVDMFGGQEGGAA